MNRTLCSSLVGLLLFSIASRAAESDRWEVIRDIEYARAGEQRLNLDLHIPRGKPRPPLIVWVHGGAWRSGSKTNMPLRKLVEDGYAVASVDYRLSTQAKFPAQIHDLKAAIRFLRGHGRQWIVPSKKIVIAGDSAGAHLAALVGVSNGHPELEGAVGIDRAESSDVQGIISFYGAANLTTILKQSTPHGLNVRVPALDLLLGGQPDDLPALARLAIPSSMWTDAIRPFSCCMAIRIHKCPSTNRMNFMAHTKRRTPRSSSRLFTARHTAELRSTTPNG